MTFSNKINSIRRFMMHQLTKNIGGSSLEFENKSNKKIEINRILICRPNQRLGNLLLITPLVEELTSTFPDCKIDLFIKVFLAPIIFENNKNVNHYFELPKRPFDNLIKYSNVWLAIRKQKYDLVINVDENSSSGRLATQFSKSKYKFFGEASSSKSIKHDDETHFAKYPVYNLRNYLTRLGIQENTDSVSSLDLKLTKAELAEGKKTLQNIVGNDNKTICLFTYATGNKCYSKDWWENCYDKLVLEYPNYKFIEVLPMENVSQISFQAKTYYSKNVREIGSVISNTALFLGADSGIMHLSSAVKTPTIGLFSVTDINKYEPYNNGSTGINTNSNDTNEIIKSMNSILHIN
jgi:ADP-heptose:LPS heptosyltransferase